MSAISTEASFQVAYDAEDRMLSISDVSGTCTVFAFDGADRISFEGLSVDDLDFDHLLGAEDNAAGEKGVRGEEGEAGDEDDTGTGTGTGTERI
jgi:hypothetical protein